MNKLKEIKSQADFDRRIKELRTIKFEQEEKIQGNFRDLAHALQPEVLIKKALAKVPEQEEIQKSAGKFGLEVGIKFLTEKLLGSKMNLKGQLVSLAIEKVSGFFLSSLNSRSQH